MTILAKLRLLVISCVLPFPGTSGQQQRVAYTLKAIRKHFHVTFLTVAAQENKNSIQGHLQKYADDIILLPSKYSKNFFTRIFHKIAGLIHTIITGLKSSNYVLGKLEFSPSRIATFLKDRHFDIVLFEYWHAVESVQFFQQQKTPCVLDMHNILWQSYARHLPSNAFLPKWWVRWAISKYKQKEEAAWGQFAGLIAINKSEYEYTRKNVTENISLFYTPMGTDLSLWPYSWEPATPHRVAYYGSLGSLHNQQDALLCYKEIMPEIWRQFPEIELWLVGNAPPDSLKQIPKRDPRVHVTGYVESVQDVLKTMTLVLCPWTGTYGFRSRVVEVMALGVPVVATHQAVDGMQLESGQGIFLEDLPQQMAKAGINLLQDPSWKKQQSFLARKQIEEKFGYDTTYGRLAQDLVHFVAQFKGEYSK